MSEPNRIPTDRKPDRVPDVYRAFWLSTIADIVWVQEPLLRYRIDPASMSQSLDGARRIDADYARIIAHIAADEASRFTREQRAIGIAGFERKRALNARYLAAFEAGETRAPFLQWLLEDQA